MTPTEGRPRQKLKSVLQLREMILSGELPPGERVAEVPLATRLGVSRTPLRAALSALEHEGLLQSLPTGGFVVRQFGTRDIADGIEIRGVMEGMAAKLAAERGPPPAALRGLAEIVEAMAPLCGLAGADETETAFERFIELNGRFHDGLLDLADSPMLRQVMEQTNALPFASPNAFLKVQLEFAGNREIRFLAQHQHRGILEAIGAREGGRAEALAREHARLARRNLDLVLADQDILTTLPGAALIRLPS